jgi:hypothetical protein
MRLDCRETAVDSFEEVRLLGTRRHGKTNETLGQTNVRKDAAWIVMEVQKGAALQLEDARTPLAKHAARAELLEKRRDAGERARTGMLH